MSEYFCAFCGLNHGPDPRAHRSPCPQVRALKFDGDGTVLAFKLKGKKGWHHRSLMHRQSFETFNLIGVTGGNNTVLAQVDQ